MTALAHNDYVSLHGQWLAVIDKKQKTDNDPKFFAANLPNLGNTTEGRASELLSTSMPLTATAYGSDTIKDTTSMFHIVEKLGGALPLYHPHALLVAIRSGDMLQVFFFLLLKSVLKLSFSFYLAFPSYLFFVQEHYLCHAVNFT